ncbi:hypothetical protein DRQ33_05985 [bacterium]|nr:MAG: hypothetical protein DRQ33_05985 [bacterium]
MKEDTKKVLKYTFWASLVFLAILLSLYIIIRLIKLWLMVLLALLLALFLNFFVDFLHKRFKISQGLGLVITCFVLFSIVVLFSIALVPIIIRQGETAFNQLPSLTEKIQVFLNSFIASFGSEVSFDIGDIVKQMVSSAGDIISGGILPVVTASLYGIMGIIVVVVLALYFASRPIDNPEPIQKWFPISVRPKLGYIYHRIIHKLRSWLVGQLFSMTIIAILYSIGLLIIGVPYALFFGILAGILCFVPYLGPPASTIGPLLFALVDSPIKAVWVILLYIGSQTLESYFLTPMVMKRQVKLHPVATIISIMAMGELFGILGIAVAIPVIAIIQFLAEELYLKELSPIEENSNYNYK